MNHGRRSTFPIAACALLAATLSHAQTAEPRHALVIGNSAYQVGALANPRNDSADVAKVLRSLGFEVTLRQDASKRQMEEAVRAFGSQLRKGGIGLFFYAGHAVQNREGRNFLLPVEANVKSEADLGYETMDVALLLDHMEQAQNRLNIVLLDSCRNNPFRGVFRSPSRGLSAVHAATGTFIAYSTQPGNVAEDGTGTNSPFTKNLLASLDHPDSNIHQVFSRITAGVSKETANRQVPWVSHSLTGEFYFKGTITTAVTAPAPAKPAPLALELNFWESVKDSRSPEELRAYLEQYPNGQFAPLARARLKALEASPKAEVATAVPSIPPASSKPKLEELQARALLLGFEGAAALAHAKMGRNMEPYVLRINAYLKPLDLAGENYPLNPWGAKADGKPAIDFAQRVVAALGAVDSRVQRAFLVGWLGVITTTTPSLKPAGFDLRRLAHEAGLQSQPRPKMTEMEYVQWLAEQAKNFISVEK